MKSQTEIAISGVNVPLLEKQRMLLALAIERISSNKQPTHGELEALEGIMSMLDEWSDDLHAYCTNGDNVADCELPDIRAIGGLFHEEYAGEKVGFNLWETWVDGVLDAPALQKEWEKF